MQRKSFFFFFLFFNYSPRANTFLINDPLHFPHDYFNDNIAFHYVAYLTRSLTTEKENFWL